MVIHRGDIWWASLPEPRGSEPGYRRPVLVIQADEANQSRIRTIMAVAITSKTALADAPGNVLLPRGQTRLRKDAVANVSQIVTLDRSFFTERAGRVPEDLMARVDAGLRVMLAL